MTSTIGKISAAILIALLSTSCTTTERRDAGTIGGGVAGGVAGNMLTGGSPLGTIAGAVGGAYVGNRVSR